MKSINFTYSCTEKVKGKSQFCSVCNKHVHDISGMNELEVRQMIDNKNGSMCASFDESQFSFINNVTEPISLKWKRYAAATLLTAGLLAPLKNQAQVKVEYNMEMLETLNKLKVEQCADTIKSKSFSRLKLYRNFTTEVVDTCENKSISYVNERKKRHISLFRIGRKSIILRTRFPFIVVKRQFMGRFISR